ncbi:hypothetical protein [Cytophaga aurantiaca]|uniref:hypothetical protein n=1 Tax=Cytophaga aurantiaca TaxID=29530 RepID=UPI0012F8975E|nr:hypothetical protein [Cytophaga aurantiaca]
MITFLSCTQKQENPYIPLVDTGYVYVDEIKSGKIKDLDSLFIPSEMPIDIFCDLDGDKKNDTIGLRLDTLTLKYGLVIQYAAGRCDTLGMGKDFLDRGFNDFNWVGIMEVAPKGKFYWNYVNYEHNISMDQVKSEDKITLEQDGIFLHESEACGGGVIYLTDKNEYAWMQQE